MSERPDLYLEDGEEGAPKPADETWVLVGVLLSWFIYHGIECPLVSATPDGGVDLHWKRGGSELLIHLGPWPSRTATFYGDHRNIKARGTLEIGVEEEGHADD